MSDVFSKLKSSVNRSITAINVKTSSSLEKSKIKTHIETLNKDVEILYNAIGEGAYRIWAGGKGDLSLLTAQFQNVKQKLDEIEGLNKELQAIDERDNEILNGTESQTQPVQIIIDPTLQAQPSVRFCPKCGTRYDVPVKFCKTCGSKIGE